MRPSGIWKVECVQCEGVLQGMCRVPSVHPGSGDTLCILLVLILVSTLLHGPMVVLAVRCQFQLSQRLLQSLCTVLGWDLFFCSSANELVMDWWASVSWHFTSQLIQLFDWKKVKKWDSDSVTDSRTKKVKKARKASKSGTSLLILHFRSIVHEHGDLQSD